MRPGCTWAVALSAVLGCTLGCTLGCVIGCGPEPSVSALPAFCTGLEVTSGRGWHILCFGTRAWIEPSRPERDIIVDAQAHGGVVGLAHPSTKILAQAIAERLPFDLLEVWNMKRRRFAARWEQCERLRSLDAETLKRQCLRFVLDHGQQIATARPALPPSLSDRAADVWEPLLALADLAGTEWSERARQAAVGLSASAQENSPISSLLLDIFLLFAVQKVDRFLSRVLVEGLNGFTDRPWMELTHGKAITDRWLSQQLRPYGIKPRSLRLGQTVARGYLREDFMEAFRRYIPESEFKALLSRPTEPEPPPVWMAKVESRAQVPRVALGYGL